MIVVILCSVLVNIVINPLFVTRRMIFRHILTTLTLCLWCRYAVALSTHSSLESKQQMKPPVITEIRSFVWQNRVLLVNAQHVDNLTTFRQVLSKHKADLLERKLRIIIVGQSNKQAELLALMGTKHCVLVGLDGGLKAFYEIKNNRFDINQLFADIDAMPMRRSRLNQ